MSCSLSNKKMKIRKKMAIVPAPPSCTALVKGSSTVDMIWNLADWDREHHYRILYCATGGLPDVCSKSATTAYGVIRASLGSVAYGTKPGWVAIAAVGVSNQGAYTNCTLSTIQPTLNPTLKPTNYPTN